MANTTASLILDTRSILGEGPLWDVADERLWWVDIEAGLVHCFDPQTITNETHEIGQRVGTVVRRETGGLMLALENGLAAFDPVTGKLDIFCDPEADKPANRFNDGKCDPAGRFWAGTMNGSDESQPDGALYCLHTDGQIVRHVDGVRVSNGIVWTSDAATMYYIDSPTRCIDAFDYDKDSGRIANRRTAIEVAPDLGFPDGMTIDSAGMIWVALWNGWGVGRFDPRSGELLQRIDVPAAQVTACAFGGPQLDDLYITTARRGIEGAALAKQPHAGGVFHCRPNATGVRSQRFAG